MRAAVVMLVASTSLGCMGPGPCCEQKHDCPHAVVGAGLVDGAIASPVGSTSYLPKVVVGLAASEASPRCSVSAMILATTAINGGVDETDLPLAVHVYCPSGQGNVDVELPLGDVRKLSVSPKPIAIEGEVRRGPCAEGVRASVTIESATGGVAKGDALVTPDFERVVRVDFQAVVSTDSTEGHPDCPLHVSVGGTLRYEARANDYAWRHDGLCFNCGG